MLCVLVDALSGVEPMSDFRRVAGVIVSNIAGKIWVCLKIWWRAARNAPFTHVLAVAAFGVFIALEVSGRQDWAASLLGVQQDKQWTFVTHVVVHDGWCHLVGNLVVLELFGPFVERWLHSWIYGLSILGITYLGAHFSVVLAPEYWAQGSNPVGVSISGYAIQSLGIYLVAQKIIRDQRRSIVELAIKVRREWVSWCSVIAVLAVVSFFLWAESPITEGPTAVGHTTGAILGVLVAVANAVIRTLRLDAGDPGGDVKGDG